MKQGQIYRITVGIIYPPLVGWTLFILLGVFYESPEANGSIFPIAFFFLLFAYLYMFIPSVIFSLLMEFIVNKRISNGLVAIAFAGFYGLIIGNFLGPLWWQVGLITGVLVGWYLRHNWHQTVNKSSKRDT